MAFAISGVIVGDIAGGIILGWLLDKWLHTAPWLSITGLILGTVIAFISIFKLLSRLNDET